MRALLLSVYSYFQSLGGYKKFGRGSLIKHPAKIWNKRSIEIGKSVFIAENSFLSVVKTENTRPMLSIGDNVCIGSNVHISCSRRIIIEDSVLMSDRVFIGDGIHSFDDPATPVINQEMKFLGEVVIKKGSFIGINSVILPGVTIGQNSIVGASSVVTKDVPDFTVVAGNPARIIKRYDEVSQEWRKK